MKIKLLHTITMAGIAVSLAVISGGCDGGSSKNTADLRNYNIVFVVTNQEHYFRGIPPEQIIRQENFCPRTA